MLALPGSAYLYQGEELGLPDAHRTCRTTCARTRPGSDRPHEHRGRDGCRVPLPWEADAPSYGFGPTEATWLPQPAQWRELALDVQRGRPGSTYETYRAALAVRRDEQLGSGELLWVEGYPAEVVAFRNRDVLVLANTGDASVPLKAGTEVLAASQPLDDDTVLPPDVTVWTRAR